MKTKRRIKITDKEIIQRIKDDFYLDDINLSAIKKNRQKWHKLYYGTPANNDSATKSQQESGLANWKTTLPLTAMAANYFINRICLSLFKEPKVTMLPTEKNDVEQAMKRTEWLNWNINNHIKDFEIFINDVVATSVYEGQAFPSCIWIRDEKTNRTVYGPYPYKNNMTGETVTAEYLVNKIFDFINNKEIQLISIDQIDDDYVKVTFRQLNSRHIQDPWEIKVAYAEFILDEYTETVTAIVEEPEIVYQGPKLNNENLDFLFFPEDVKSLRQEDCDHVIVKYDLTLGQLKSYWNQGIYEMINDDWMEIEKNADDYTMEGRQSDGMSAEKKNKLEIDDQHRSISNIVHLADCYYSLDVNNDGIEEEMLFTVVLKSGSDPKDPILLIRNKFLSEEIMTGERPVQIIQFQRRPGSIMGLGICEKLQNLQETIDTIWTQMLENGDLIMKPWGFYGASVGGIFDKRDKLKIEKGVFLPVEDTSQLLIPNFQNNLQTGAQFVQMGYSMWERHSGINDQVMGRQGGVKTATATVRLLGEAMQNMALNHRIIANGIKKIYMSIYQLYRAYMPPSMTYRIVGPDGEFLFKEITKEELVMHPDIDVNIDIENTNKAMQREIEMMLYRATTVNPMLIQLGLKGKREIYNDTKRLYEMFDKKDIAQRLKEPSEEESWIDPMDENYIMLCQGQQVKPKMGEDHLSHISSHQMAAQMPPPGTNQQNLPLLAMHIQQHQQMEQQLQMLMQAAKVQQNEFNSIEGEGGVNFFANPQQALGQGSMTSASGRTGQGMGDMTMNMGRPEAGI